MEARYRVDYPGEFVITNTIWSGGKKEQEREWIENPIENQHISGRATCIGSANERDRFDYTRLQRHRGGLLGSKKLQTYGIGDVALEMRLDFAVECQPEKLQALIENGYYENNVIYTTARNCIENPGDFYLIPLNPMMLNMVLPVYLAAFDGHQEIFLLGYSRDNPEINHHWRTQLADIVNSYRGTKFYAVGEPSNVLPELLNCPNLQTMDYREYISYCDI